jgi:hypothetical protein
MTGATERIKGGRATEIWCGAGWNQYFETVWSCPGRIPVTFAEIDLEIDSHSIPPWDEIQKWLKKNMPATRSWYWHEESMDISFVSDRDAVFFKLVWI